MRQAKLDNTDYPSCVCDFTRWTSGSSSSARTRAYIAWMNMNSRCFNINNPHYTDYGGRGITVCERWHIYDNFFDDMGHPPDGLELDRIDTECNYEKANCIWASRSVQVRNTRRTIMLSANGETLCLEDWCKRLGIGSKTIKKRLLEGWTMELIAIHGSGARINPFDPMRYIRQTVSGTYQVRIRRKQLSKTFKTLDEAITWRDQNEEL